MKIAVYTIAKNEERYAKRWAKSAEAADYRVVLDTGSSDGTVAHLREEGVDVHEAIIEPWRFDVARNAALALVPQDADVCVSLDLDEVLAPGWREALEAAWTPETTLVRHPIYPQWSEKEGRPETYYAYVARVHAPALYRWRYAVHEILTPVGIHRETLSDSFVIEHRTDHNKDKRIYTNMLSECAVREPNEPRHAFYLGIDLFNRGEYAAAAQEFERYLSLTGKDMGSERGFVLRLLGRTYVLLRRGPEFYLRLWRQATAEAPLERESWYEFADMCAQTGNWAQCLAASLNALRITDRRQSYRIDFAAWNGGAERLLDLSAKNLGIPEHFLERLRGKLT